MPSQFVHTVPNSMCVPQMCDFYLLFIMLFHNEGQIHEVSVKHLSCCSEMWALRTGNDRIIGLYYQLIVIFRMSNNDANWIYREMEVEA